MQNLTPAQALSVALNHLEVLKIGAGHENARHLLEAYVLVEKTMKALLTNVSSEKQTEACETTE